jgi:hypothetical protein
MMEEANA